MTSTVIDVDLTTVNVGLSVDMPSVEVGVPAVPGLPEHVASPHPHPGYPLVPAAFTGAAIQACIDEAEAAGGGTVQLQKGIYYVSTTITIQRSDVRLVGMGHGSFHDAGSVGAEPATELMWTGSAGGIMLCVKPESGATHVRPVGVDVLGIAFHGDQVAGTGLQMLTVANCEVDIFGRQFTDTVFWLGCASTPLAEGKDSQFNRITVVGKQNDVLSGLGSIVWLTGITAADVDGVAKNPCFNDFWVYGEHYSGDGIILGSADNNSFWRVFIGNSGAPTYSVRFKANADPMSFARNNRFVEATVSGVIAEGTPSGTYPSMNNRVQIYGMENSLPVPVIEAGATLIVTRDGFDADELDHYWNGTAWVSRQIFTDSFSIPFDGSITATTYIWGRIPVYSGKDLWVEDVQYEFYVGGGGSALSGSHKWSVAVNKVDIGSETQLAVLNIDSGNSSEYRKGTTSQVSALLGTAADSIIVHAIKTGTPGALTMSARIRYRVVFT